jgi:hypothetical protein
VWPKDVEGVLCTKYNMILLNVYMNWLVLLPRLARNMLRLVQQNSIVLHEMVTSVYLFNKTTVGK